MNNHTEIYLHFVWATWDRHPLLTGEVRDAVYRSIQAECREMRVEVIAIGGMEDHVHVLVRAPASVAPSQLVKQVKGASSFLINSATRPTQVFRWQGGYGVFSVSRQHVSRIRGYVLNQEEHHRNGRLAPFLEPTFPGDRRRTRGRRPGRISPPQSAKADFLRFQRQVSTCRPRRTC